jgi:hypothetical protein
MVPVFALANALQVMIPARVYVFRYLNHLYLSFATVCFFRQWHEQIRMHIDLNYIRPIEKMMGLGAG